MSEGTKEVKVNLGGCLPVVLLVVLLLVLFHGEPDLVDALIARLMP